MSIPLHADALPPALLAPLSGDRDIVVRGPEIPERHWRDWTRLPPVRPLALARPRTAEQVATILKTCNEMRIPVVTQGGLTGLVGGAQPTEDCIALSLDRMTGVEEFDVSAGTMTVRAGTSLQATQAAAEEAGLYFPLDLGSRGSCTIGGNLATNAGGNRVIRYGMARDQVLGLEVILADGTVLTSLNKLLKNNAGYDLRHIFVGSEGTLGVITRAVLRLQPKPTTCISAMCAVDGADQLLKLLSAARGRLGPALTSFEAMWPSFYDFMTTRLRNVRPPFARRYGAYALLEMSGFDAGRDEANFEDCLASLMESGIVVDAVLAKSGREIADLWAIRDGVAEFSGMLGPRVSFDVGLPVGDAAGFVTTVERAIHARWPDAVYLAFGHLGDGNLHLVVHVPAAGSDQPGAEIAACVYQAVRERNGTVSAEHGIGLTKRGYLGYTRSEAEIAVMRRIKAAFDPNGILNPGKILG